MCKMGLLNKYSFLMSMLVSRLLLGSPALAQTSSRDEGTLSGAVVSSRSTLVVRREDGHYQLFIFDRDTVKPRVLAAGSTVRVGIQPLWRRPGPGSERNHGYGGSTGTRHRDLNFTTSSERSAATGNGHRTSGAATRWVFARVWRSTRSSF